MGSLGSFIGFFIFPMISDNKGPRLALIGSWATCVVGCLLMGVANNYYLITIGYLLAGIGVNPAITLHYTFINDHSTGKFREFTAIGV
jgi:MFS family permease